MTKQYSIKCYFCCIENSLIGSRKGDRKEMAVLIFIKVIKEIEESGRNSGEEANAPLTPTFHLTLSNTIITLHKPIATNNTTILEINLLLLILLAVLKKPLD